MYICVRNIRVSLIAYVVCAEMRSTCFFFLCCAGYLCDTCYMLYMLYALYVVNVSCQVVCVVCAV